MSKSLPCRRTGGFTLIEVLIALLILLVGLLGVAGVQMLSLQQANNSNVRSQVNLHAQNMVELVRANGGSALTAAAAASWQDALVRDVPTAAPNVVFGASGVTVTITWNERQYGNAAEAQTFTLQSRLVQ